jgi:hypothetical protein
MKQLPSFLCIGTQKAGTSWLYEQLRQHPEIWMPPIKELHYFDHLYCQNNRSWTQWHIEQAVKQLIKYQLEQPKAVDFSYIRYLAALASKPLFTEAWYRRAFDRPSARNKVLGDITPEYCAIGDDGIAYLKHLLGAVKIIWIIRDPTRRALSQLRMNATRRGGGTDMPESMWLELAGSPEIVDRGDYADYIPRWGQQFGSDDLLFLPFQHLAQQPYAVLQAVESFIGVKPWDGYAEPDKKVHATPAVEIPATVTAYFDEQLQPQRQFLADYFPADFIKAI